MDWMHELSEYGERYSSPPDDILAELERATHLKTLQPRMLSGRWQGAFLTIISKLVAPKYILEIGTFTGYSAICLAKGLQPGGRLITIDPDAEILQIAREYISKAGLDQTIQIIEGLAGDIIPQLEFEYDLVFIDADKASYLDYYKMVKLRLRKGGLILADNILWSGKVLQEIRDQKTEKIHAFNQYVANDHEVEVVILPLRDGVSVIRKK
jgi:caffeoyl-CoA O-methyltransferase